MSETLQTKTAIDQGPASLARVFDALLQSRPGILASEAGGELAWLRSARERDAAIWKGQPFPTRQTERWKYTSLTDLKSVDWAPAAGVGAVTRDRFPRLTGTFGAELVFVNGSFKKEWSRMPTAGQGATVSVLSELVAECVRSGWTAERRELLAAFRAELEASDSDRESTFSAMNTSLLQDAALIDVRATRVVHEPILICYFSTGEGDARPFTVPRVFAHLGRNAQASIVELYAGLDEHAYVTNAVSDVRVGEGATLSYCKAQLEGAKATHIGTTRVHQARDAKVEAFQFSFGAKMSRQDLHIGLEGQGSEATLDGLYMVSGSQHVDNYTLVEHAVPHTTSDQLYKGLLDGESRAVFNGHVHIHKDAQKSSAAQANKNLVLSAKAEVDTKPELDIEADDVKAAHGATIGQIDPDHVFYLETRAIPKDEAVRMLSRGFAQDVVFRIKNDVIRAAMRDLVDRRFTGGVNV